MTIKELDVVALKVDVPELDLKVGDAATIVHMYADGMLILEFIAVDGDTIGLLDIDSSLVREATSEDLKHRLSSRPGEPFMERLENGKLRVRPQPAT